MADKSVGTQSFATQETKSAGKKVRTAVIGCGMISNVYIDAMNRIPEFEIVGGCDIRRERLDWFTKKTGVTAVYEKWDDLLREVQPDAVVVATPNGVHMPASVAAAKAGCHVMTAKPMAMTPAECRQMIDASKKAGKLLAVGLQFRYRPATEMFVRARDAGDIGDIMYVKCHALRRRGIPNWGVFGQKELQGGGPLIDLGVHIMEAAHYCMGSPKPVAAVGNIWTYLGDKPCATECPWPNWDYQTYTVEDLAVGHIRFENGAILQIEASYAAHIERNRYNIQIMGSKGGFDWESSSLFTDRAGTMLTSTPAYTPDDQMITWFTAKMKNFVSGILHGTPLRAPGEAGMAIQKMLDGIYRSAANGGREVAID
ncbi:MAG: Gfo/Idh/MocA family protein [Lentisphaeria bacterium]|jgi:predicted dehydrogenase